MASSPPPKGLPGFLRRSLRNPYDDPSAPGATSANGGERYGPSSTTVAAAASSSHSAPAEEHLEPTSASASASASASDAETETDVSVVDEEEELKKEEEAVEAATSRVNRKFRFGLSLGGSATSGGSAGGSSEALEAIANAATGAGNNDDANAAGEDYFATPADSDAQDSMKSSLNSQGSSNGTAAAAASGQQPGSSPRENRLSYKEATFEKAINAPVVSLSELRKLSWNGIPPKHRPQAWKILLGYLPANAARREQSLRRRRSEYRDSIAQHYDIDDNTRTVQEQEVLRQVLVDVPRTAPDVALFRDERIRYALGRLLYIWACRHPASSYVQGINDLATPLISVFLSGYIGGKDTLDGKVMEDLSDDDIFEVEADTYWCLTNLLAGIQDHYTADQPGVQRMVMRLEELVARIDADLTQHLQDTGILFLQFAFKWMNCLLLREFNLPCVMRLWDAYLSEGDGGFETFHVYVCAAFLCQFSAEVQMMQFDELFGFMQNMPTGDWGDSEVEIVLSQAFVLSTLFTGSDAHLISQNR